MLLLAGPKSPGIKVPENASTNYKPYLIAGVIVVLCLFGGFGTWAAVAQITTAAIAKGVVVVDTNWRTVQHLEGGIVERIYVRDGDLVEKGQLLLKMDDTRAKATLAILQDQLDEARAAEARLVAERDELDFIEFPDDLIERMMTEPDLRTVIDSQENLFNARRDALKGQVTILRQRISQLDEEINGLTIQESSRTRQLALIQEELDGVRQLHEDGYAPKTRLLALQREHERLSGDRGTMMTNIARAKKQIGETELQIIQLKKTLREEVVNRLRDVQAQIFNLEERYVAAKDTLDRIEVRAPADGYVLGMNAHTDGGVIGGGQPIMNIVPQNDLLLIDARVKPDDIHEVAVGAPAEVRLTSLSRRSSPYLFGQVTSLSADVLTDPQGGQYYNARVVIGEDQLARLVDIELVPGMPADVMIATGEDTPLEYILSPFIDSWHMSFR